ncbi:UNVERIFIED_CONTAM: hypothetical protein K2H54_050967 [Gekko kuhli]
MAAHLIAQVVFLENNLLNINTRSSICSWICQGIHTDFTCPHSEPSVCYDQHMEILCMCAAIFILVGRTITHVYAYLLIRLKAMRQLRRVGNCVTIVEPIPKTLVDVTFYSAAERTKHKHFCPEFILNLPFLENVTCTCIIFL